MAKAGKKKSARQNTHTHTHTTKPYKTPKQHRTTPSHSPRFCWVLKPPPPMAPPLRFVGLLRCSVLHLHDARRLEDAAAGLEVRVPGRDGLVDRGTVHEEDPLREFRGESTCLFCKRTSWRHEEKHTVTGLMSLAQHPMGVEMDGRDWKSYI